MRVSLVPAFTPCSQSSANDAHGAPLAFPSCDPPVQASRFLTIGGPPDTTQTGANFIGAVVLSVKTTSPEDVLINSYATDVRCQPATSTTVCNSPNLTGPPDYSGQIRVNATMRISDHYNGPGLNEAATVTDIPLPVDVQCANTSNGSLGGLCTVSTSANAVAPGFVPQGSAPLRAVVQLSQVQVLDGGASGTGGASDATLFADQGVYVP